MEPTAQKGIVTIETLLFFLFLGSILYFWFESFDYQKNSEQLSRTQIQSIREFQTNKTGSQSKLFLLNKGLK